MSLTQFQALIVGAVSGALMKHSGAEGPFLIDVEVEMDSEGNYTNKILVRGRVSNEELLITVEPFGEPVSEHDEAEAVAAYERRKGEETHG